VIFRGRAMFLSLAVVLAACFGCRSDLPASRYSKPRLEVIGGELHLLIRSMTVADHPTVSLRRAGQGGWDKVHELRADYTCTASAGRYAYLILSDAAIVLDSGKSLAGRVAWPFDWRARAALVRDQGLVAYGVKQGSIVEARIGLHSGGPELSPTSPPAAGGDNLFAGAFAQSSAPVVTDANVNDVRAVQIDSKVWLVFSSELQDGEKTALYAVALDTDGAGKPVEIARVQGRMAFDAVDMQGLLTVLYARVPNRIDPGAEQGAQALMMKTRSSEGLWTADTVPEIKNPYGEQTLDLNASVCDSRLHIVLVTPYRLMEATFDGKVWTPLTPSLSDPQLDWLINHWGALFTGMWVAVLVLAVSAFRRRSLPNRACIAGVEYRLAPWSYRGAASMFDLTLVSLAANFIHWLGGREPSAQSVMIAVFCFEMVYFTGLEFRSGRTLGKRLFGLIVITRNGGYPSWSGAALRNLPRALFDALALSFAPIFAVWWLVALCLILNTRGSQREGDLLAGTYVVREMPRVRT
jgi:uncharacterized RDD family membrane protein YckC